MPAFAWHWSLLPLLVIAAGSVARLAGLQWAQNKFVMGAFCVVAVALSIHDIPKIFAMDLHIACLDDTVRYTTTVKESQLCSPDDQVVPSGADAGTVAIITNVFVLGVGIALWIQRRWAWLAVGSGLMFVAAGALGRSPYALPIANFGEICITLGFIVTCAHFARLKQREAEAVGAPSGATGLIGLRQSRLTALLRAASAQSRTAATRGAASRRAWAKLSQRYSLCSGRPVSGLGSSSTFATVVRAR